MHLLTEANNAAKCAALEAMPSWTQELTAAFTSALAKTGHLRNSFLSPCTNEERQRELTNVYIIL